MEAKQAQWEASDWFASWFGSCSRGPPIEGELTFEKNESKKTGKKKGKKKASRDLQGPSIPARASSVASRHSGEAQNSDGTTKRYLIDNGVLQSNRPGVSFRHSKEESKKVKEMRAVPWGEIVEGTDEGDGWLKVGIYFLPMTHQGKPIITLVEDPDSPAKANGLRSELPSPSAEGAACSTSPAGAAVQEDIATSPKKDVVAEPEKPAAPAAQESASSPQNGVIAEPEKPPAHLAEDSAGSPKKGALLAEPEKPQAPAEEGALSAWAGVDELKKPVSFAEDKEVDALVKPAEQPQRAWFVQPSVGTWLHALPQVVAEDAECTAVEDRPIHVEAPPLKWEHCPSVGTWAHRRPIGIAACSEVTEAELDDLLQ